MSDEPVGDAEEPVTSAVVADEPEADVEPDVAEPAAEEHAEEQELDDGDVDEPAVPEPVALEEPVPFETSADEELAFADGPEPGAGPQSRQPRIRNIDFSRPTKFSQEHQRRIVRLHETFCRAISTQLSPELRLPLEFEIINATQLSWASATAELPSASLFGIMDVVPGTERALIACELPLLHFCLDRMLGGDGTVSQGRDELTEIELALSQRLIERLTSQLSLVWAESVDTTFELEHVDTQIANVQLVTPSEAVLALTVEVKLERGSSTFTVLFPHVAVEPILEKLSVGHFGDRQQVDYDGGPVQCGAAPDRGRASRRRRLDRADGRPGAPAPAGRGARVRRDRGGREPVRRRHSHPRLPSRSRRRVPGGRDPGPDAGGREIMTSDDALLLLGESVADAVCGALRGFSATDVEHGQVSLATKGELAFQDLPALGVVSSAAYMNGATGGNVIVMPRRAARKLALLASGGDPDDAGEGPISPAELAEINAAAGKLLADAAVTTAALLGEELELAPASSRAYDTPAEAFVGLDLGSRATSMTIAAAGESFRLVQLMPNALLIRMTQVFDDRAAARSFEHVGTSVPPDTVREVTLTLRAELGRTRMSLLHASSLDTGAAVALDRRIDDPVELFVNGRSFGTGELVSQGGRFAVRITEVHRIADDPR